MKTYTHTSGTQIKAYSKSQAAYLFSNKIISKNDGVGILEEKPKESVMEEFEQWINKGCHD
jgi:hypothetical protein